MAKQKDGTKWEQEYAFLVNSDWAPEEILPPSLVVDQLGAECIFNEKRNRFDCPDPKDANRQVWIASYVYILMCAYVGVYLFSCVYVDLCRFDYWLTWNPQFNTRFQTRTSQWISVCTIRVYPFPSTTLTS